MQQFSPTVKSIIKAVGITAVLMILVFSVYYYGKYFKGVWPVFNRPQNAITETINTTDMPLSLPGNVSIGIFAEGFEKPRVLAEGPEGTIFVSDSDAGTIVALIDEDQDRSSDNQKIVIDDLNRPHGLAFYCTQDQCYLYIAETDMISRYAYEATTLTAANREELIPLPGGGRHWTRTIEFTSDSPQKMLISVGSSCDLCIEDDARRGSILIAEPDGSSVEKFAEGLRNSPFMAFHPKTNAVWATEMGVDFLGDDLPPDEVNIIDKNNHYGWPFCYGNNVPDRRLTYSAGSPETRCNELVQPAHIELQAHSAPLGIAFFPETWGQYAGDLLVAYHGSWNRSIPTGYKLMRFEIEGDDEVVDRDDFVSGWLINDSESVGRPVDLLFSREDTLYVTDDKANVVYVLWYEN